MAVRLNKINKLNEIYFITFTILGWKKIFINDKYCNLVYKWFDYTKEKYGNKIYGYVIMPSHLHLLMKITEKSPLPPLLVQNAKRFMAYEIVDYLKVDNNLDLLDYFTVHAKKNAEAKHKVFKDKYDSLIIQSEKFFLEKLNYIHKNPCRGVEKLVENPEDYKYSSASNYILGKGFYEVEIMEF